MNPTYDIAVVGSGFAGSLVAMIARRLGHTVVLLEKGKHPRSVIGESSTPLSNLLLEEITTRYDLPRLSPLCKWGTWQECYPDVACGLKRGFTFYHHQLGRPEMPDPDRRRQLLVAASPHDRIADTHWFRSDFDAMLVHEAQAIGVDYFDEVTLDSFVDDSNEVSLAGKRNGLPVTIRTRFVVDATGPRGFLHHVLRLPERSLPNYPSTEALFSHFSNVKRIDAVATSDSSETPPYPAGEAAVHHIFDGGWIWVLHFNNGITSAGVAATSEVFSRLNLADGERAWKRLIESIPSLQRQFATANREQPFSHVKRLSFQSEIICGKSWALLPSAAGFVDPLLSTGFSLTLLGVSRLAALIKNDWGKLSFSEGLNNYAIQTRDELLATTQLISSLYANMNNFEVFAALSLLYFASASFSETALRLKKPQLPCSFLLHDHVIFWPACRKLLDRAHHLQTEEESTQLIQDIISAIEPIDIAGLCNRHRHNWYPVDLNDLLRSADKLQATPREIVDLLKSCDF